MTSLRAKVLSDPARRRDLAAIHVAKKQLGMEDDAYRDMLWTIGRVRSAGDLDFSARKLVLDHLKACGFKYRAPSARDPQSKKIRALWLDLKSLDALRDSSEDALATFVKRETGVAALQWLSSAQASKVIEALKGWARRERKKLPPAEFNG
jgi:phage gp16-like protein